MPLNQHGERHFIANFQDMSEYEQQRAQLNRSLKLDSLGNVAGGVAHDFNNILGIIVGYASLLSSSELDKQQTYIEAIEKACDRGQKLTKSLLTFAKKGNQGASKVNINRLIAKNRHLLETAITSKIILNLELATCECIANVEEDLFENMLLNMSINAMHAMPDGGSITIATECMHLSSVQGNRLALKGGKYIKLTISDTGFGIPKENIDKIFDPFFTTSTTVRGWDYRNVMALSSHAVVSLMLLLKREKVLSLKLFYRVWKVKKNPLSKKRSLLAYRY